jgi:hypothetical protein
VPRNRGEGRSRITRATQKQEKAGALWAEDDWRKYAKCFKCRHLFVANNYADRKVRVNNLKIGGKIICPWCRTRGGKRFVQFFLMLEKLAHEKVCDYPVEQDETTCKCTYHVARRLIAEHEASPGIR